MDYAFRIADLSTRLFKPDFTNVQFTKTKQGDDQFGRMEISGAFRLVGEDAKFILDWVVENGDNSLTMQIYQNGIYIANSLFNTKQTTNKDYTQYSFTGVVLDKYSDFVEKGDLQYNILAVPYTSRYLRLNLTGFIEETTLTISNYAVEGVWASGETIIDVTMDYLGAYYNFDVGDSYTNWSMISNKYTFVSGGNYSDTFKLPLVYYNGIATFKSQKAYGSYVGSDLVPPQGSSWVYIQDDTFNDIVYPLYRRPIQASDVFAHSSKLKVGGSPSKQIWTYNYLNINGIVIPVTNIDYIKVTRKLTEVIEYIIGIIDSSIQFDDTGADTDSFYSFKTMIGDVEENAPFDNNLIFNEFLIAQLTDIIPDPDTGQQKSNYATLGLLSFNDCMTWMKTYGFYWFLENRSGTYYYRLLHKKDIALLDINPNLRNYFGYNYMNIINKYTYDKAEYSRLVNKQIGKALEMMGVDAIFYNVEDKKNNDISSSIFYVDLNDIVANGEDEYDVTATDKFVLITAYSDQQNWYQPRNTQGILIPGELVMNGDLGWPKVTQNLISDLPDSDANINNSVTTVTEYRLKKRKIQELVLPISGINDFNLSGYLDLNFTLTEIEQITQEAPNNIAKLKIRS